MTVIPVINVETEEEAARKLGIVQGHTERVHVDVADGTFAPTRTFRDAARLRELAGTLRFQAHLMVAEPEAILPSWLEAGADEVVVHLEPLLQAGDAADPPAARLARMREVCLAFGAKLLIAGGPDLETRSLLSFRAYADGFLVLAVDPGPPHQAMQPAALDVVRVVRDTFSEDPVWVDGGVNGETIRDVRAAGATGAVSGSIFAADDPIAALAALQGA